MLQTDGILHPSLQASRKATLNPCIVSSHLLKTGHTCLAAIVNTLKEEGKTPVFQYQSEATMSKQTHAAIRMTRLGSFKNTVRAKLQLFVLNQVLVVYFVFMQNMFLFEQNKIVCCVKYIKVVTFILMAFYYYY